MIDDGTAWTPSPGGDHDPVPQGSGRRATSEAETMITPVEAGGTVARRGSISPGQRIGPYRIEALLGSGGMGEVYSAEHIESGHRLAVKVLASHETWSHELRERFAREGKLAATINHPNSLYVYGTAEIDGTPLIAMELATGGTLEDLVEAQGPLRVRAAVDAILQVIAGLEAAYEAGVLHRDVKPANCFVDRDGNVKIGDYGLSFPTGSAADTRLTMTGAIMATPAFAPPEQLRGDDVDVRTDIYAVGATLFNLLTGRLPLEATGAVQMLAAVLERIPESPRKVRPEIPEGLARAVLRCLEKKPADRFQNYGELRRALLPFSSAVPFAAQQGIRLGAGIVDWLLLCLGALLVIPLTTREINTNPNDFTDLLIFVLVGFVYSVPEGLWGRSLGKRLTGLELARPGGDKPDYRRVLLRTAIYLTPGALCHVAAAPLPDQSLGQQTLANLFVFAPLLLFVPWNRNTRKTGWHDRLSGTVVVRASRESEEDRTRGSSPLPDERTYPYSVGPYRVSSDPAGSRPGRLLEGFDPSLRRSVWIVLQPDGASPTPASRRDLSRKTRLRWLNGKRSTESSWDAYEAPDGQSLFAADATSRPWPVVRRWLLDLAEEIKQVLHEGSDPGALSAEHVWITAGGNAMLLDFVPPGSPSPPRDHTRDPGTINERVLLHGLLSRVARRALCGADDPEPGSSRPPELPLPLHVSGLLIRLSESQYGSCDALIQDLKACAHRPDRIGRRRRFLQFAAPAALMFSLSLSGVAFRVLMMEVGEQQYPGYRQAVFCLLELGRLESNRHESGREQRKHDLQVYLAGPLKSVVQDTSAVVALQGNSIPLYDRADKRLIQEALRSFPDPTAADIRRASDHLRPTLTEARLRQSEFEVGVTASVAGLVLPYYMAPLLVLVGVALRGGALLRLFGIVVVTTRGKRASRGRILARSLITWAPFLVVWLLALLMALTPGAESFGGSAGSADMSARSLGHVIGHWAYHLYRVASQLLWTPIALFLAGATYAIARPDRAIQDRVAGTCLVPR